MLIKKKEVFNMIKVTWNTDSNDITISNSRPLHRQDQLMIPRKNKRARRKVLMAKPLENTTELLVDITPLLDTDIDN